MNTNLIDSVIRTLEELGDVELGRGEVAENSVKISWSTKDLYVEIGVYEDGRRDWLWINRETGEVGGTREPEVAPLPGELTEALSPFKTPGSSFFRCSGFIPLLRAELGSNV